MTLRKIVTPSAGMFNTPSNESERETDALFGETVEVINNITSEVGENWAEIVLTTDGYQAFIKTSSLSGIDDHWDEANYHVTAPRALMTERADIKSPEAGYLSMRSLINARMADSNDRMMTVHGPQGKVMGYISADHVMAAGSYIDDYVTTAESLIGCPYRWGGRDSFGFDCSALVQLSMACAGIAVPRNSGDQEDTIGVSIEHLDDLRRGDLVFWKGHVGIMQDEDRLLHANMWHGMTASENLRAAIPRLEKAAGPITRLKRP